MTDLQAQFPVRVESGIRVTMRDGMCLALKITRPDIDGSYPAIVEYNPYRRIQKPKPSYQDEYPPVVPYLAEHGYVVVQFDVRGTGCSGGYSTDIYSNEEQQDGYEIVEWAASQPWSTGKVGMIGKSYGAVVQWHVAVQNPPHLHAIIVRSANDDVYTRWTNPGGSIRPYMFESYAPIMAAFNFAPPDIEVVGPLWAEIWRERLERSQPWSLAWMSHLLNDDYWQSRSLSADFGRIRCPTYVIDGWADWYASALLHAFANLNVPKRALIGPWGHYYAEERSAYPGPRIDTRPEYLRWFDYWLKGIQNGITDEPPVTLFVREYKDPAPIYLEDAGFWRNEDQWPPARTVETKMYMHTGGSLSETSDHTETRLEYQYFPAVGLVSGRHGRGNISPWAMPLDQRLDEAYSQCFTTEVLVRDTEVTGCPVAILYVSSTANVAYFALKICDVAPDGTSKLVASGGLLGTHRNSHENPEPMSPGKIYELRIELSCMAYLFRAGHRIRVDLASSDFQNAWPTPEAARNTVVLGGVQASYMVLPILPPQNPPLPQPTFAASPHPLPPLEDIPKPIHTVTIDLINQATTSSFRTAPTVPSSGINESSFTVSHHDPSACNIRSQVTEITVQAGQQISVTASCTTASTMSTYSHTVDVQITVDGAPHFQRSWTMSVPRNCS